MQSRSCGFGSIVRSKFSGSITAAIYTPRRNRNMMSKEKSATTGNRMVHVVANPELGAEFSTEVARIGIGLSSTYE